MRRLKPPPSTNVLDVGPHVLTTRLRRLYDKVDSLGINPPDEYVQPRWNEQHFEQDLSDFGSVTLPSPSYDLIVCCGVVEHITSLPREWMGFFGRMMRPDGLLVIETPNGAALKNRLMMPAGLRDDMYFVFGRADLP